MASSLRSFSDVVASTHDLCSHICLAFYTSGTSSSSLCLHYNPIHPELRTQTSVSIHNTYRTYTKARIPAAVPDGGSLRTQTSDETSLCCVNRTRKSHRRHPEYQRQKSRTADVHRYSGMIACHYRRKTFAPSSLPQHWPCMR